MLIDPTPDKQSYTISHRQIQETIGWALCTIRYYPEQEDLAARVGHALCNDSSRKWTEKTISEKSVLSHVVEQQWPQLTRCFGPDLQAIDLHSKPPVLLPDDIIKNMIAAKNGVLQPTDEAHKPSLDDNLAMRGVTFISSVCEYVDNRRDAVENFLANVTSIPDQKKPPKRLFD